MYGLRTDETMADELLMNRFDYDGIFGTALNRSSSPAKRPKGSHGSAV